MPLYEYECPECGEIADVMSPVENRDDPVPHDDCDGEFQRVFQVPGMSIEGRAFVYRGDPNSWFE